MHVLFVHPNYPAQFGHVARHLVAAHGLRCTFVSRHPPGTDDGVERIRYVLTGGTTQYTHPFCVPVEDVLWRTNAVYQALRARPDVRPDLIVAHAGHVVAPLLADLYSCPLVNYFEFYSRMTGPPARHRPDLPAGGDHRPANHMRNSLALLNLEECDLGYSPTVWQRDQFPAVYQPKVQVIFDGLDLAVWHPHPNAPRRVGGRTIPDGTRIVTYVSRGLESVRGFDIFMRAADIVCRRRTDVLFVVVGEDRSFYHPDDEFTGGQSFRQWTLARGNYDLSRFHFTGPLPAGELADLFSATDLHVYLTVPFVLSWSLLNALACGAPVLGSDTAPVREVIRDGETGLLTDFFDAEAMADRMGEVLDRPQDFRHLGQNGVELVRREYGLDVCLPRMVQLYHDAATARASRLRADGTS